MPAPTPALIDSLQRVIAFQDSALALAATKVDSIWVAQPPLPLLERPIVHALLGAVIGGALSIWAARVGAEQTRRLEDAARQASDRVARNSLIEQLVLILQGTQTIGVSLPNSQVENRSASSIVTEMLALWEPFDSLGPAMFRLGNVDLQRDLFQLCMKVRLVGNGLLRVEKGWAEAHAAHDSGTERAKHQFEDAQVLVLRHRTSIKTDGPALAAEASALAVRLRSARS
jgi:hypothetical protein